ncbi:Ig-like domain-containing protein [Duganella sp. BuS-21]|uniref:Ig-like domain-containing protein n=1 Tax=Duganella sp. BuS-21 TaxID=2943848 RepID=UPI0035A681A5
MQKNTAAIHLFHSSLVAFASLQTLQRCCGLAFARTMWRVVGVAALLLLGANPPSFAQTNGGAVFSQMVPPPSSGTVGSDGLLRVTVGGIVVATDDVWPTQTIMSAELIEGAISHSSTDWTRQMGNDGESAINVNRGFNLPAALGPGTHTLQVKTYTDAGRVGYSPAYTVTVAGTARDGAGYVSWYLPSQVVVGGTYTGQVVMTNTGTTSWASGSYWLGSIGDAVWGITKVDAAGVPPGGQMMFTFNVTAPASAGNYNFRWQMFHNGVAFGTASPVTSVPVIPIPAPTVSLSSTGDGRHYPNGLAIVAFTGTATAGTGATLQSLRLVEGSKIIKESTSVSSFNETLTFTEIGTHNYQLQSTDSRGQVSLSNAIKIYIDGPSPSVALTKPANGAVIILPSGASSANVQITGTGSAAPGYTLTKLELFVDGNPVSTPFTGSINQTVSMTSGSHTILLRATDNSGSAPGTDTASISVTSTGSAVTFSSLALTKTSGVIATGQTLSSGINGYVQASGLSAGDMVNRVELREGSSVLNSMDFPFQMSGDGENPVNVQRNFYNMTGNFGVGAHDIYVRAYTYQGSYGDSPHYTVTVTQNAAIPTVTFTTLPDSSYTVPYGTTAAVSIIGTANDAGGTVARVDILDNGAVVDGVTGNSINKTIQLGANSHKLQLRAQDNDGAYGYSTIANTTVTAIIPDPTVSFTAPTTTTVYSPGATVSVTISGTAVVNGGRTIKSLALYDGTSLIKSVTTSTISMSKAFAPGTYNLKLLITDSGDAKGDAYITLTIIDGYPPIAVSMTAPATGGTYYTSGSTTASVLVTGSASGGTISKIEVLDNGMPGTSVTTGSYSKNVLLTPGVHVLRLAAYNGGSTPTLSQAVTVTVIEGYPPLNVSLTAPVSGTTLYTLSTATTSTVSVTVTGSASGTTVSKIELIDNGVMKTSGTTASFSKSVALSSGNHVLSLRAYDPGGMPTDSASVTITVIAGFPPLDVKITAPVAGASYYTTTTTAPVTVTGSASGGTVSKIELVDNGAPGASVTTASYSKSVALTAGNHVLSLRAYNGGNVPYSSVDVPVKVVQAVTGNAAEVVSQTVPTSMRAGETASITVVLRNLGTTTWTTTSTHKLGAQSPKGDRTWVDTALVRVPASTAFGNTATFTIPITAPSKAGTYTMQWQMQDGDTLFGAPTELVSITVTAGAGPTGSVTAEPNNVRVSGSATASIVFSAKASATTSTGTLKRLELYKDAGDTVGYTLATSVNTTAAAYTWSPSVSLAAGLYQFKLRVIDSASGTIDTDPIVVNVTNSTLLGTLSGVRLDKDKKPQLIGWVCQPSTAQFLNFDLFLDAPTVATGGRLLTSGLANVSTETDDAAVKSSCSTASTSHHFNIDLSPYTAEYAGRALYVSAKAYSGTATVVLPCASNNCTVPGAMRIGIATPVTGDTYVGPASVYMRAVITGATAPFDEVAFSVDDVWTAAVLESPGVYSLTKASVANRAAQYRIHARVRQGNSTVYSAKSLITVSATATTTAVLAAPIAGSTSALGVPIALVADVSGAVSKIKSVKFYAGGNLVATGMNANDGWNRWSAAWSGAAIGTYSIQAKAFDGGGVQLGQTTTVSVSVLDTTTSSKPLPFNINLDALSYSDAGTLPGTLGVGSGGEATYSIDLVTPPGTAGLQPALALNYNSSGTNGIVGLGWSLSGLSSIHRCGKTIAQDAVNGRINFDKGDRLCIDGERLVLVSNAVMSDDAYWADGAVYRTEIDSFMRVSALGSGAGRTFKVEHKDGRTMTFGDPSSTAKARVLGYVTLVDGVRLAQPLVRPDAQSWAVDKILDRSGNSITFHYSQSEATGEHVVDAIRYGANGLQPHAMVKFSYEDRPDSWTRYIDGTRHDLRQRLSHIKTYAGVDMSGEPAAGALVRDYVLTYEISPTSGRSMMKQVAVSAFNAATGATEVMPPTVFDWGKPHPSKTPGFTSRGNWPGAPLLTTHSNSSVGRSANHPDFFAFQDMENHGLTDVLERRVALPFITGYDENLAIAASPLQPGTMRTQYRYFHNNGSGFDQYQYQLNTSEKFVVLDLGDFNGDGAPDLLVATESAGSKICISPLGNGVSGLTSQLITFTCASATDRPSTGANVPGAGAYVVDVVGDGRSAIYGDISATEAKAWLYLQNEKLEDRAPPYAVLPYNEEDRRNSVSDTLQTFVSFNQSIDFVGIGKHADVRWALPYFRPQGMADNGEPIGNPMWVNLTPAITVTDFRKPGTPQLGGVRSYALHEEYPAPYCEYGGTVGGGSYTRCDPAPYRFDAPIGGAVADFSGSGYSNLMFGFVEINKFNSATRADATLCLSTGRELDCGKLPQHSDEQYKVTQAVANFVGDGAPSVLMQETLRGTGTDGVKLVPVPVGPLQMCRLTGMGEAPADVRTTCTPWAGLMLTGPGGDTTAYDQVYFMDLLGTGRTQAVYYHAGKLSNGVWQEDGRWEVFEPVDVAVDGQALDRIHQVTNGLGAKSNVVYSDGLARGAESLTGTVTCAAQGVQCQTDSVVSRRGATDLTTSYPQRVALGAGKVVSRLMQANGVAGQYATSYRYFDPVTDVAGRGALGYGEVVSQDEKTGIVTTTSYSHVWPKKGMMRDTSVATTAGVLLSKTTNSLDFKQFAHPSGQLTYFPYTSKSVVVRRDLDGSDLGTVTVTNQYNDGWGNLSEQEVQHAAGSVVQLTNRTVNTYQPVSGESWLLGLPTRVEITQTNATGSLTRTTAYSYDAQGRPYTETIEPDFPQLRVLTTLDRTPKPGMTAQGLVSKKTQTWRDPVQGVDVTRTSADVTFDTFGRFPLTIRNALDESEERTFDGGTGALLTLNARDGLNTIWTVDGFGRVRAERSHDGNEKRSYLKNCENDCPLGSAVIQITEAYHHKISSDPDDVAGRMGAPRMVYSDSVGHALRKQTWGFDGTVTIAEQRYDSLGRLQETDQPGYGATGTLSIRYGYDELNRIKSSTTHDTGGADLTSTTKYSGFDTTLTNPLGQKRKDTRNVIGKVVQVLDANNKLTKFDYDPFGNLKQTTDPLGNLIKVTYDRLGRKTDLDDPDLGLIHYDIDPLGRTYKQSNPELVKGGKFVAMGYDLLDRMTSRLEPEMNSYWVYATKDANGAKSSKLGKLVEAYIGTPTNKTYSRTHNYDALGRPTLTTQLLSDGPYTSNSDYDAWSRVVRQTYRRNTDAAKVFDMRYNSPGYQSRIEHNGIALSEVQLQDAADRPVKIALGNGLIQKRDFNSDSGRLDGGTLAGADNSLRVSEGYEYDKIGSVRMRSLNWDTGGFDERFEYDDLNRLKKSTLGTQVQDFTYDDIGNLKSKTGVGNYNYLQSGAGVKRPHALLGFGTDTTSFQYDLNGNQTNGAGRTATWTTFDMPKTITKGVYTSQFVYGPEYQRTWQARGDGTQVIYAGAQEVEIKGTAVTVKTYWPNGLGVEIDRPGAMSTEMSWTYTDNLGSVVAITNEQGQFREGGKLEYDAWGKRRSAVDNSSTSDAIDGVVDNRGFTGHEMLDLLDLVHMNGRVYDPMSAKFLSGDPLIQDPLNGQSYNRYSYVMNNPTNMTDPTGFCATGTEQTGTRICAKEATTEVSDGDGNVKLVATKMLTAGLKALGLKIDNHGSFVKDAKSPNSVTGANIPAANTSTWWSNFKNGFFQGVSNASQSRGYPDVTDGTADKTSGGYLLGTGVGTAFVAQAAFGGRMPAQVEAIPQVIVPGSRAAQGEAFVIGNSWAGRVDYSSIANPANSGAGREFTLRQKQEALALNRKANGGVVRSDKSGTILTQPQKSQRGVTPDPNEWQFDHIDAKSCGGTNCSSNLQILSRKENREKSDN